jgi:hypothetical protein
MSREFQYLESPQVSKLVDIVLQLATDLHVTTNRLRSLELLLARKGAIQPEELDRFEPDEDEQQLLAQVRDALMDRLLRIITETGPAEHPLRDQWQSVLGRAAAE